MLLFKKKVQKFFLMFSEMFLRSSLVFASFMGLYNNFLISNAWPPSNATPTQAKTRSYFKHLSYDNNALIFV